MTNLKGTDLNLLPVLDALLREGSTVRAGERLGLSQPAVSAALGRLRHLLGDELFFRRGQGMEPSARARALEEPLRRVLEDIETLLQVGRHFDPAVSEDCFRISGSDFFAEMLMPHLAERIQAEAPSMRVHLVDLVPDSYVDTLERYQVDLALMPRMALPDWVRAERVFVSSFAAVARQGHPRLSRAGLRPGAPIPLDLFCDLGHVLFSPEGNASAMGDAALARVGRQRRVMMTLPVFSGVYRAVAGSDMIALLPRQLAEHVAQSAGIVVYEPPMRIPPAEIVMVWHRRHDANPAHLWLRGQIAGILAPLDEV